MQTYKPHEIEKLASDSVSNYLRLRKDPVRHILGIPRGGMAVAYLIARELERRNPGGPSIVVDRTSPNPLPTPANLTQLVVDDIVDTGRTITPFIAGGYDTLSLVVRDSCPEELRPLSWGAIVGPGWVEFPWDESSGSPEESVVRILEYLGVDPTLPSLKETPRRFLSWLSEFKANQQPPEITTFEGIHYDQMVLVRDIPFTSLCEHHLLPFMGTAAIAYIPTEDGAVIGLSKLARVVQWRAANLQVQERLTEEVQQEVVRATNSTHVGVVIKAEHSCMSLRGPKALGHSTVTSALSGDFRNDAKTREEFLRLAGL